MHNKGTDLTTAIAVAGFVLAIIALLWNVYRDLRTASRLRIVYYIYEEDTDRHKGPVPAVIITNVGTLPAFVVSVKLAERLPWHVRWPVFRSLSFKTRNRWWLRWIGRFRKVEYGLYSTYTETDLLGRLEPGELKESDLQEEGLTFDGVTTDDMTTERRFMNEATVNRKIASERVWVVVQTGLRSHVAKLQDFREQS